MINRYSKEQEKVGNKRSRGVRLLLGQPLKTFFRYLGIFYFQPPERQYNSVMSILPMTES